MLLLSLLFILWRFAACRRNDAFSFDLDRGGKEFLGIFRLLDLFIDEDVVVVPVIVVNVDDPMLSKLLQVRLKKSSAVSVDGVDDNADAFVPSVLFLASILSFVWSLSLPFLGGDEPLVDSSSEDS